MAARARRPADGRPLTAPRAIHAWQGATKPADWDEDAPLQIPDPKSEKPEGWLDDAPDMVPDGTATMPDDWDADEDGEWEAPLIPNPDCKAHGCGEWKAPLVSNPDYKGKWYAPKVDNPEYKGVWGPRQIPNPNFFVDEKPYAMAPIGGIGIELWTMQDGILFDNVFIGSDPAAAAALADKTFKMRKVVEDAAKKVAEREVPKGDGFVEQLKYYVLTGYYYALDNKLIVGGSLCVGLIPLLLFCCLGGSKKAKKEETRAAAAASASAAPAEAAAPDDDDEGEEGEEEEEEEEEEEPEPEPEPEPVKAKGGAKKRTPKAS